MITATGGAQRKDKERRSGREETYRDAESQRTGSTADTKDSQWIRERWHQILGVSHNASESEIKAAYRERIQQYHPDKTVGLGSELRSLAEEKTKELNAAYAWALLGRRA